MDSLLRYVGHLPMFAVYVAGIALAIIHWRRCPRAAAMVLIACVFLPASAVAWDGIVSSMMREGSAGGAYMTVAWLVYSVAQAAGWLLVIAAVFTGRREADFPVTPDAGC